MKKRNPEVQIVLDIYHPRLMVILLTLLGLVTAGFCFKMAWVNANFSGQYDPFFNVYHVQGRDFDLGTLQFIGTHESAHKYWFKDMNESQRKEYEAIFMGSNEFVTNYAKTNAAEDFAETYAYTTICELDITRMPADRRQFFYNLNIPGIIKIISRPDENFIYG